MKLRQIALNGMLLTSLLGVSSLSFAQATACFQISLGQFCAELFEDVAPVTVADFISYAQSGAYNGSVIHHLVPDFVIQGGGYTYDGQTERLTQIPTNAPVINEFSLSNTRGTLVMVKLGDDPDNATSQWFINLSDNPNLDTDNGGYTVFGQVIDNGMTVVDSIASLDRFDFGGALQTVPLINFPGTEISEDNFVVVSSVEILDGPPP